MFVQVAPVVLWNSDAFITSTLNIEPCFRNIHMALGEDSFNVSIRYTSASHPTIQQLETGWTML